MQEDLLKYFERSFGVIVVLFHISSHPCYISYREDMVLVELFCINMHNIIVKTYLEGCESGLKVLLIFEEEIQLCSKVSTFCGTLYT